MKKIYENPLIALMIAAFIVGIGLKNFFNLPVALYPDTSKPSLSVNLDYHDMTMEGFRTHYGKNIEARLNSIEGVELVEGSYYQDSIRWDVRFDWGIEEKKAKVEVQSVLDSFVKSFPDSWDYQVYANSSSNGNLYIALSSEFYSTKELHNRLKEHFLGELNAVTGVDSVGFWLPLEEYIRIELKREAILERNISLHYLKQLLMTKTHDENAGDLKTLDRFYDVILPLGIENLADLKKLVVSKEQSGLVYLEDVAQVSFVSRLSDQLSKVDGKRALLLFASMRVSGNITQASRDIIKIMSKAPQVLAAPVDMQVLLDPSLFIESATENLFQAVLIGFLISGLIVFLFLSSLIQTLIICFSIPLSVLGGFSLMKLLGIEINLISLGALALSVGMVVDGAIVVLENIMRNFQEKKPKDLPSRIHLVLSSVEEVKSSLISSLLTTIIVFVPLSFTAPLANALLGDLARVMVCVLVISLGVTLYIIPPIFVLFSSRSFEPKQKGFYKISFQTVLFFEWLKSVYLKSLQYFLKREKPLFSLIFFVACLFLFSLYILQFYVKRELLAEPASDKIWLHTNWSDGMKNLEERELFLKEHVEPILEEEFSSELKGYYSEITGRSAHTLLSLKKKEMLKEVKEKLEKIFKNTPIANYYTQVWTPVAFTIPKEPLFKVRVSKDKTEDNFKLLENISDFLYKNEEIHRVEVHPEVEKKHYYEVKFKDEQISRAEKKYNIPLKESIKTLVSSYLEGGVLLRKFTFGEQEYEMKLFYEETDLKTPKDLGNLIIRVGDSYGPLRHFISLEAKKKQENFYTKRGNPAFELVVWPKESLKDSLQETRKKILEKMEKEENLESESIIFEDPGAEINESLQSLLWALLFSIFLILFVLLLQFGTFKESFIIMLAIPFGVIGVSLSLYLFKSTLSLNSMLGIILLAGTAVNNSILYLDFFKNSYKKSSLEELESCLLEAASLRFKPILITTLTTIFGMIPMALAFGDGGEVLQPLGISVAGGLGVSTFLVLVLLPLILYLVEKRRWV
jgi:HAE1 family hydrophobic/amphiphilic exporter-1